MTKALGLEFAEACPKRVKKHAHGVDMWVLALDDLLRSKRAAGRPKDLLDIQLFEASEG